MLLQRQPTLAGVVSAVTSRLDNILTPRVEKDTGFRGLWRKIKPADKPEEGIPFDTDDAMFSPPVANPRLSYYDPSVQHLGQDTANRTVCHISQASEQT